MPGLPNLTFQHWSGLTPYTSSCELAGSCVFDKQSVEIRLLQPVHHAMRDALIQKSKFKIQKYNSKLKSSRSITFNFLLGFLTFTF